MTEKRKKGLAAAAAAFILYGALAARPIPPETSIEPRWIVSLESGQASPLGARADGGGAPGGAAAMDAAAAGGLPEPLPFMLGRRFGFVEWGGALALSREKEGMVSISGGRWAEFGAEPESVEIRGPGGEALAVVDRPGGYPFFLDGRSFVMGRGQDSISEICAEGRELWAFDFPGPVTVVDAAAGLLLAGTLDGAVALVDSSGRQAFFFEPGGSRLPAVLGAAISRDGSRLAVVSGIDSQRFLVLERFGAGPGDFRVVYHEFVGEGFRRPVHVAFAEGGRLIAFERQGGLGIYDAGSRLTRRVDAPGELLALDCSGARGLLFAIFADGGGGARLVGIRAAGRSPRIVATAPFCGGGDVFLGRMGGRLVVGGGQALAAFDLERR